MTADKLIEKRRKAVADALRQFHPELMTAILSDESRDAIAAAITSLIEAHCLKLMATLPLNGSGSGE